MDLADFRIKSVKESFWVSRIFGINRLINYSYSFQKQSNASFFKNNNCCFQWSGKLRPSHQQIYLKRTWHLRTILCGFLLQWRHLLFDIMLQTSLSKLSLKHYLRVSVRVRLADCEFQALLYCFKHNVQFIYEL